MEHETLPRCQFKGWFCLLSFFLYLNSLSPGRQLDVRHLKHIRGMLRRNYRLTSPWKERHGLSQQPASLRNLSGIWQLLADSVHPHHIPTDPISVCNLHATVLARTIISRKINFVCKILKIFPSTYKSHVMNQGACGWMVTIGSKSKQAPRCHWYANLPSVARAKSYHCTLLHPPLPASLAPTP
jgi:hypothetical protein